MLVLRIGARRRQGAGQWKCLLLATVAVAALGGMAQAADLGEAEAAPEAAVVASGPRFEASVSAGVLNGASHELVYDPASGKKISELIWTLDDVAVVGGGVAYNPASWLSLNLNGWINASDPATMDDFDWLSPAHTDWSDWSHHDATDLDQAWMLDASAGLAIWQSAGVEVEAIAGYRRDRFDWSASGGSFIYSGFGYRDSRGEFTPGEPVISYRQDYSTPYLGIGGTLTSGELTLKARVEGSWWVQAEDRDIHHLRDLVFREEFEDGRMVQATVELDYRVTEKVTLKAGWQHLSYDEMKGPTEISSHSTGTLLNFIPGDAAGADHTSDIVSVGLSVALD